MRHLSERCQPGPIGSAWSVLGARQGGRSILSKARLTRGMNAGTMPSTLDRSTPGSRGPEITRLAQLHSLTV